jgi:Uncharacterized conserved protein
MTTHEISRRSLVLGAAGVSAFTAGCERARKRTAFVSVTKAPAYSTDLALEIRRLLNRHRVVIQGKHVVLKPNLVEFDRGSAINTHPAIVLGALEAVRSLGAAGVQIAEGPGHRRITMDLAEGAGYFQTIPKFAESFVDLNLDDVEYRKFSRANSTLKGLYLPRTILDCDLVISLPKMKTHHWAGATLSMKNFFGIVPGGVYGWPKNILHWAGIHECIADLQRVVPNKFAIVDGIDAMEGNGPIQGTTKHVGVLVAGADLPAVDATCCRIMGIDPTKLGYLHLAGLDHFDIKQLEENPASLEKPFSLLPELQHLRLS